MVQFKGPRMAAFLAAGAIGLAAGAAAQAATPVYHAEIARTRYGIPHISGADYGSVGYGEAYAFAQDNLCLIADKVVTVNGERSKYFGADGVTTVAFTDVPNLEADVFFKANLDIVGLRRAFAGVSKDYQALVRGYAAGFNRYLRDTPKAALPAGCRDAAWLRPITLDDLLRLNEERMIQASAGAWLKMITAAAPPAPVKTAQLAPVGLPVEPETFGLGSNGWAFGRDVTANGAGVLLGNPHFPWESTNRFYQVHLTIPGKLDVMGVTIGGAPGISIGFNHDVAWTHTVSTDRHFTVAELTLDPKDPTAYLVDGKSRPMIRQDLAIEVKGEAKPRVRTVYASIYGPLVIMPQAGVNWSAKRAYALRDANHNNLRSGEVWLDIARAKSVGDIQATIRRTLGIPWVNTIAADRTGQVLYADVTATPNVSAEKLKTCAPPSGLGQLAAGARIYLLDGARSACDWDVVKGTPAPGLMPGEAMPAQIRTDYVANSNDSYWLANGRAPMAAYPPIVGPTAVAQNLRTRQGLLEIEARLAGADGLPGTKVDPASVEAMLYRNRNLAADLVLDDVARICAGAGIVKTPAGKSVDLARACAVLAKWDRRMNLDSVGAPLFIEFWRRAERIPNLYAVAFDPADPVHTPRGLKADPVVSAAVLQALTQAVETLDAAGVPIDAPWASVQVAVRGAQRIPVPGGEGSDGVLNAQQSKLVPGVGYVPYHGSSYIQVVTFDDQGPVADGILTYSQSTDPASPHYADQTWLHAGKGWNRLPFHAADIAADPTLTRMTLEEPVR
jgi:acyl-homoserine-lactone acylase